MVKFQAECPRVLKDDENPHFRSKFSSILAMKEAVQPLLAKHGLAVMQFPIGDPGYERAGCKTVVIHESGESIEQVFFVPIGDKVDAQKACSAVSYARRFAFSGALGLVSSEDVDKDGQDLVTAEKPAAKPAPKLVTKAQVEQAKKAVAARGKVFKMQEDVAFEMIGKDCIALMGVAQISKLLASNLDEFLEVVAGWEPTEEKTK
jgi:hypothetical protein